MYLLFYLFLFFLSTPVTTLAPSYLLRSSFICYPSCYSSSSLPPHTSLTSHRQHSIILFHCSVWDVLTHTHSRWFAGITLEDSVAVVTVTLTCTYRHTPHLRPLWRRWSPVVHPHGGNRAAGPDTEDTPEGVPGSGWVSITLTSEADALAVQRFLHTPVQPIGPRWVDNSDEVNIVNDTTFRAYSVFHCLLAAWVPE